MSKASRLAGQAAREERIEEKKAMLKQQREFNRKKEYARQCRVKASVVGDCDCTNGVVLQRCANLSAAGALKAVGAAQQVSAVSAGSLHCRELVPHIRHKEHTPAACIS